MQLAYVTQYDATDIRQWSGAAYYIAKSLRSGGAGLNLIGPLRQPLELLRKAKQFTYRSLGKRHLRDREPGVVEAYAEQISRRLAASGAEIVFSPSTVPIARLKCPQPIAIWIDATFASMVDYYPEFSGLSRETLRNGEALEQAALDACSIAIFSSEWAARTALQHYRLDPAKVHVVPFGGNVDIQHGAADIDAFVDGRQNDLCRLLFVGADWIRKGGDVAVALAQALNQAGLPTELTLVGPIPKVELPDFVRALGPIGKQTDAGRQRFEELLKQSHFLVGPSRSDCSPLVFCEANAFGVPCLTTGVGGIPEIIRDGVNGFIAEGEGQIERYRDLVLGLFADRDSYRLLARRSFANFENRLNWSVAGRQVCRLLDTL